MSSEILDGRVVVAKKNPKGLGLILKYYVKYNLLL